MSKNPCAKTVRREEAYEVYATRDLSWVFYVLKKYRHPDHDREPFTRWLVNVVSPMTSERGETGDEYSLSILNTPGIAKLDENPLTKEEEVQ